MTDWRAIIPEYTLRPQQIAALEAIERAFDDGASVVVLEAPTGVGKSIIELAMCRAAQAGFIVTPQKTLQDQLGRLPEVKVMKGRGSYSCSLVAGLTAGNAPCVKNASIRESNPECSDNRCPYFKALAEAKTAPIVAHNYASLIAQTHIGGHFGTRELLCLDEGHTAVDWIRNYMTLELTDDDLAHLTTSDPPNDSREFLGWFRAVMSEISEIPAGIPERLISTVMRVLSHKNIYGVPDDLREKHAQEMSELIPEDREPYLQWATNRLKGEDAALVPWNVESFVSDGVMTRKMIPIKIAPMANVLTNLGTRIIIVTATVLDDDLLVRELGLKARGHKCVTITTAFSKMARPIKRRYVGKMTYSAVKTTTPKLIDELAKILAHHKNEAGIIHTVSHALAYEVFRGLSSRPEAAGRQLIQMPREGRDTVIDRFLTRRFGPNAVLIGPGLMEGIDGAGDSARWQAMCKVPWPHRRDPVVSYWLDDPSPKNKRFGERWYSWKTAQQCVQGFGRVCRAEDDFGVTYLLDSDFERILKTEFIPDYVLDAIE